MARPRRFDRSRPRPSGPRTNDRIRVPEIRVIGPDGDMLGIMQTNEAKKLAREKNLDLVEVNPKASPPVCKVMDYGRFKYEEKKKQAEAKKRQSKVELKEVKLRPKTDDHDVEFKTNHVRRFLEDGNKVKITVRFRGREITHPETAQRQIDTIAESVDDLGFIEQQPRMEGRTMTAIVAPRTKDKPGGKKGNAQGKKGDSSDKKRDESAGGEEQAAS